nr:HD domain-containing protein [Rikenellaceae bacterium]
MNNALRAYIEREILPRYDHFDTAHRRDHVEMVIRESLRLAEGYPVNKEMVYTVAAYHDTGLEESRERHHLRSGEIVRADATLRRWFSEEEIEQMAQAVEDHRASSDHAPRSIYGCIVAEADRTIDPELILRRTVQYGMTHYPAYDGEEHYRRFLHHLHEKYAEGGYLRLWMPDPRKEQRLAELRALIRDEAALRACFERLYTAEQARH